ncbi:MarR family winged helix-turn-helix transcriptional regulator [Roseomonas haemaphysalidis]|uniref:MarR family transcriptional regulator n=1 Tax=Roseomonas haemaphysalidis TaxID=2768162 RepID=A0ABS3KM48_9PROT|nr:MarR family transcriptional regulator [Roseomonas haemaphysalidis]MBO1078550.1 MarR family transcriptional regulator [Roseomonas haemaphysalidis]
MPVHEAFGAELRRVFFRWRSHFDSELRASGQTLARARALAVLAPEPEGLPQRDLALALSIEHPTLVRLLDGLQQQGLVTRLPAPGDRRANRVALTPAAGPVADEVVEISARLRERVLEGIDDAELATALDVLRAISANLDALSTEARS